MAMEDIDTKTNIGRDNSNPSDRTLLRQFVVQDSEAAFAHLVHRHLNLVYATCRREIGEAELAHEVAQTVFLLLARKAPSLQAEAGLAGWLFQTARFAAKNALRQEMRRQRREREAAEMIRDAQTENQAQGSDIWQEIEPNLNDALAALGAADREAVLLRFLEGQSLAEVGARLGLSENTARMRVTRAVAKMRGHLARAGLTLSVAALVALLADRAAQSAPPSCLAAALRLTPLPGLLAPPPGPAGPHLYHLTQGVLKAMWIKTITTSSVIAAVCIAAVTLPFVALSAPKSVPTGIPVARVVIVHHSPKPIADASILAVVSQKAGSLYDSAAVKRDTKAIKKMGFFSGLVGASAAPDPKGGMDISYSVTENPFIKTIRFTANTPDGQPSVPVALLKSQMQTKEGQVLNTDLLAHDLDKLLNHRGGYIRSQGFFSDLDAAPHINPMSGTLILPLVEIHIAAIQIQGNSKVPTANIIQQIRSKTGSVLNDHLLQKDMTQIYNMGVFDTVGPYTEMINNEAHQATIVIPVVEKQTVVQ